MKLTIEQAFQQAVEAHKAGNLQVAERLYRAILQVQPNHPEANHNLGVLAVSLNKTEASLPLFKIAVETKPNNPQFWISYIDAHIKVEQFDSARNLFEQAKKVGLTGKKFDALEAQLTARLLVKNNEAFESNNSLSITEKYAKVATKKQEKKKTSLIQKKMIKSRRPTQEEVTALKESYQNGQYDLAETLAKEITRKYPDHQFSWKVLGAVFKHAGRLQDSLICNQKAVEIYPNDAEAHSNLGITLKELGRLHEAEISYKKALAIKPDFAEAYYNLGITLQEFGRLEEAETSYKKAITIKPDHAGAHCNLGNTLKELGRVDEAEASYKKAIAYMPEYAEKLSHTIASLNGLNPVRASDAYVSNLFDEYAEKFESSLVGMLNYKTPNVIADLLRPLISSVNKQFDILDLGCGTGLAGEALIDFSKTLVGIDLSKEMLKIAEKKNIYSRLVQGGIHHALDQELDASYDIVVSSDVFVYIGELKEIINRSYEILREGGFFAYSTEALFDENNVEEAGLLEYKLNSNGRYSHSSKYLLSIIDPKQFILRILEVTQIRLEKERPVMGYVVILQKIAGASEGSEICVNGVRR